MGLDNRFMGHFKSRPEVEISLAYFRKFFNLNDWMLQHCAPVQEDNPYDVTLAVFAANAEIFRMRCFPIRFRMTARRIL